MKYIPILFILFLGIVIITQAYDFTALEEYQDDVVSEIGGHAIILIKDGAVIYQGERDGFSINKKIPIASAVKWLSAATIMTLADDGLLALDDSISDYLPIFTGEKGNITIRQCLSHTSGLPGNSPYFIDTSLTLAQAVDSIAIRVNLLNTPGTAFAYGGNSLHIAGRIAEIVTGQCWDSVFVQRIARPCSMDSTDYLGFGQSRRIGGGANSSAEDYANFVLMFIEGGVFDSERVLSEWAIDEITKDQTFGATIVRTIFDDHRSGIRYGLGLWRELIDSVTWDAIEISCLGFYGFSPWINYCRGYAGVIAAEDEWFTTLDVYDSVKVLVNAQIGDTCGSAIAGDNDIIVRNISVECNPNPFNSSVRLQVSGVSGQGIGIEIFDLRGNIVAVSGGRLAVGDNNRQSITEFIWQPDESITSGVYIVKTSIGEQAISKRIVYLR